MKLYCEPTKSCRCFCKSSIELDGRSGTRWKSLTGFAAGVRSTAKQWQEKLKKILSDCRSTQDDNSRGGTNRKKFGGLFSLIRIQWNTGLVGNGSETGSTRPVDNERIVSHGNVVKYVWGLCVYCDLEQLLQPELRPLSGSSKASGNAATGR